MIFLRRLCTLISVVALAQSLRAAEREVHQVFPVQPGCTVEVDSYRGDITIDEGDAAEVRVSVNLDFNVETEAEADRLKAHLQLELKAEGNVVRIRARNPSETGLRFSWNEQPRVDLAFRISVPRQCNLKLKTNGGNVTVGAVAGRMEANVEKGTIFFRHVEGSIDAGTKIGDVVISRCLGAVTVHTLQGSIRAGTIEGPADLKAMNGSIEVMMAIGALTAMAEAGDVTASFPRTLAHAAKLTASGGTVLARIDPGANCDVEASAVWGNVQSKLPLVDLPGETTSRHTRGRLNRGGPLLTLRANGGSVKIEAGETAFE